MSHVWCLLQHHKINVFVLLTVFTSIFTRTAFSQAPAAGSQPDDTPSIKVGLTLYANYTYTDEPKSTDADGNTVTSNAFDVTRSYLNFTGNINHRISFRVTPDITRATVTGANATFNNSLVFRIKYAFAQFGLDDWTGKWKQTWVRIGANQTPLVDWEEGVYRYRFQGTTFTERVGRLTSSDLGASFHTNFPKDYGEVHIGVYNGEGYSNSEPNNEKAVQMRATVRPLATGPAVARGLRLTGFYDLDNYIVKGEKKRLVLEGLFEHSHIVAGFDYLDARDKASAAATLFRGRGYSAWATPIFKEKGNGPELLLRYDFYKPNRGTPSQTQNTAIAGFAYWFPHQGTVSTALLFDFERVQFPGTTAPTQKRYAVHGLLNF